MMNKDKLKSIVSKKAKGDSGRSLQLYQMFFFERILERLSVSSYSKHIILKGGLLLASIIGSDERTTKDMDAVIKGIPLEKEFIENLVREILQIDLNDGITFVVTSVDEIREIDEYGGFRIMILSIMDNMKTYIAIELSTGDVITPKEIKYQYNCIFEKKKIPVLAYTIETFLAEKFHTIVTRGSFNTRMKDFYDIYVLLEFNRKAIDFSNISLAIRNTFKRRGSMIDVEQINVDLKEMEQDENMLSLWKNYQATATYAKGIEYTSLYKPIYAIMKILE
jgi:Domain of unknown function (DUF1814).